MKYNERIRALREDNDLNQTQVAAIIHVPQRTYSDYESGRIRLPVDSINGSSKVLRSFNGLYLRISEQ